MLKTCLFCGETIESPLRKTQKYCSKKCYNDARRLPKRKCPGCGKWWQPTKRNPRKQRFCTHACWHDWHRGENHQQYNRITVECEICGKKVKKIPSVIKRQQHYYCSVKCASIAHRSKINGKKNPRWRGGSINSRGPAWFRLRAETIKRHGEKCAICGMTVKEHLETYEKTLHVHHKDPYRLTKNNDESNLVALCIPCHMKEEMKLLETLTPQEKQIMQENSEKAKELGLDKKYCNKVPCPKCGGPKERRSELCRKCRHQVIKEQREKIMTCDCGRRKMRTAKGCKECYLKTKRTPPPGLCMDCGKQLKTKRAKRCPQCNARFQGKKIKNPGRRKKVH